MVAARRALVLYSVDRNDGSGGFFCVKKATEVATANKALRCTDTGQQPGKASHNELRGILALSRERIPAGLVGGSRQYHQTSSCH